MQFWKRKTSAERALKLYAYSTLEKYQKAIDEYEKRERARSIMSNPDSDAEYIRQNLPSQRQCDKDKFVGMHALRMSAIATRLEQQSTAANSPPPATEDRCSYCDHLNAKHHHSSVCMQAGCTCQVQRKSNTNVITVSRKQAQDIYLKMNEAPATIRINRLIDIVEDILNNE